MSTLAESIECRGRMYAASPVVLEMRERNREPKISYRSAAFVSGAVTNVENANRLVILPVIDPVAAHHQTSHFGA